MSLLGVVLAGVAAALLVPPGRGGPPRIARNRLLGLTAPAAGVSAAAALWLHGHTLALMLVLAGGAAGAGRAVARSRSARSAAAREARVVELCEALAAELRAGLPPQQALEHCAATWPELDPVAGAARLGADVPSALRRHARAPGAAGLRDLASAWQVSATSGAGLAAALTRIADSARHQHAAGAVVAAELASARATAWLVALLPVASLSMGAGLGGDPWGFLLDTTPGLGCLAAGLLLALAGLSWLDRIAARVNDR